MVTIKVASILIFAIFLSACSVLKQEGGISKNDNPHYELDRFKTSQSSDSASVVFKAIEIESSNLLSSFTLKVNDRDIYHVDDDTTYALHLEKGDYQFLFMSLGGFQSIKTETLSLGTRDSVMITFYTSFRPIE